MGLRYTGSFASARIIGQARLERRVEISVLQTVCGLRRLV
jgi:hypothetical protein